MSKAQNFFWNLTLIVVESALAKFTQFSLINPLTSMMELELNSDQKAKVAYLNKTTSETFQDLILILIMSGLAQFNLNSISP